MQFCLCKARRTDGLYLRSSKGWGRYTISCRWEAAIVSFTHVLLCLLLIQGRLLRLGVLSVSNTLQIVPCFLRDVKFMSCSLFVYLVLSPVSSVCFRALKHEFYVAHVQNWDRGGTVVKVLCYKSDGRWFGPIIIFPIALWHWGRLSR